MAISRTRTSLEIPMHLAHYPWPIVVLQTHGGSQFFLNVANNKCLDWFSPGDSKHPVFGKITEGYEVVVVIAKIPTRHDCQATPIMMNSITISGV